MPPRAQRRPGREPRRHLAPGAGGPLLGLRSTKAGARTPATPVIDGSSWAGTDHAQRRPGREPRRHIQARSVVCRDFPPAQRRPGREPRRHLFMLTSEHPRDSTSLNEGRGENPGDTSTPATGWTTCSPSLNEGRGENPGDTPTRATGSAAPVTAQRRPGREPRRHCYFAMREAVSGETVRLGGRLGCRLDASAVDFTSLGCSTRRRDWNHRGFAEGQTNQG